MPCDPLSLWRPEGEQPLGGEDQALALVDAFFPVASPHVPHGRGHDCAELAALPEGLALSTDLCIQDVHFRLSYYRPEEAGGKALASAVSDLAAAGARPLAFSLGLTLPPWMGVRALSGVLAGMARKAEAFGMTLSGGDLSRGPVLCFSVTVWGAPAARGVPFVRRDRPRPEDALFVIGEPGLAAAGFQVLEARGRAALASFPRACQALLDPAPLLEEGRTLALLAARARRDGLDGRLSLMDLSDGLARDVPRLLGGDASPLGADLCLDMAHPELLALGPEGLILRGGEEYALLGACSQELFELVRQRLPRARAIGRVTEGGGLRKDGLPLALSGFDHFTREQGGFAGPATEEAARRIIRAGREAWKSGFMAGFNGNISCRLEDAEGAGACLITRSGCAKGRLRRADLSLVRLPDGALIEGQAPSSEGAVHLGIYRACPDSRVVLHSHPPRLLALCLRLTAEERLVLPLPEAGVYREQLAWTPFFPPGSRELGDCVSRAAMEKPAIWMERHGLVVHGPDMEFALSLTEELEQLAGVQLAGL